MRTTRRTTRKRKAAGAEATSPRVTPPTAAEQAQGKGDTPPGQAEQSERAIPLATAGDVLRFIERTTTACITGKIDQNKARLLLYAAQTATAAVKSLVQEKDIEEIKQQLAELQRAIGKTASHT